MPANVDGEIYPRVSEGNVLDLRGVPNHGIPYVCALRRSLNYGTCAPPWQLFFSFFVAGHVAPQNLYFQPDFPPGKFIHCPGAFMLITRSRTITRQRHLLLSVYLYIY